MLISLAAPEYPLTDGDRSAEGACHESLERSPRIGIPRRVALKVRFNVLLFGTIE